MIKDNIIIILGLIIHAVFYYEFKISITNSPISICISLSNNFSTVTESKNGATCRKNLFSNVESDETLTLLFWCQMQ